MSEVRSGKSVLLIGAEGRFSRDVTDRLRRDGYAMAQSGPVDAVVLNAIGEAANVSFVDLPDETFVAALGGFLDAVDELKSALAGLREGGALVALTTRGYLGAWGAAEEASFSGALVGLMRSICLENAPRGIRANVVACDYGPDEFGGNRREPPDQGERIAAMVAFLVGSDSLAISGEVLLANAGRGLQRREARDRRDQLADNSAPAPLQQGTL